MICHTIPNTRPVLGRIAREHARRSSLKLGAPGLVCRLRITCGRGAQTGDQLGRKVGALGILEREGFPQDGLGLGGHASIVRAA